MHRKRMRRGPHCNLVHRPVGAPHQLCRERADLQKAIGGRGDVAVLAADVVKGSKGLRKERGEGGGRCEFASIELDVCGRVGAYVNRAWFSSHPHLDAVRRRAAMPLEAASVHDSPQRALSAHKHAAVAADVAKGNQRARRACGRSTPVSSEKRRKEKKQQAAPALPLPRTSAVCPTSDV